MHFYSSTDNHTLPTIKVLNLALTLLGLEMRQTNIQSGYYTQIPTTVLNVSTLLT
jgi:hypothetical protein